jgi:tRNA-guanine family transglycosylase
MGKKRAISLPAFFPVTTFGGKFPLDEIVRPHLQRFAPAIMVSYHYAQKMTDNPSMPLFIDSGGFASLFEGSKTINEGEIALIQTKEGTVIHPAEVLSFQEKNADIGATLDFLIPPGITQNEAVQRQELTIKNALWALRNRRPGKLRLYASIQAWDPPSVRRIMQELVNHPFDGFALGGMVPRISQPETILAIVDAIRKADHNRPFHLFGVGQPKLIKQLFAAGVDSVDSSSYVQYAAEKKYLNPQTGEYEKLSNIENILGLCTCKICRTFSKDYLLLDGEVNTMALVLHNLGALNSFLGLSKEPQKG